MGGNSSSAGDSKNPQPPRPAPAPAPSKTYFKEPVPKDTGPVSNFARSALNDLRMGLTNKFDSPKQEADYRARTAASVESNRLQNARSGEYDEERAKKSTMARAAAPAPNFSSTLIADPLPPAVPDPDEIGDTEQALLDQQKKGRSSTIATSSRGLLSGEDDTRKKRSLMGSLIT